MTRFTVENDRRTQAVDVTDRVAVALADDAEGTVTVFVEHTTAAVPVTEAESNLLGDVETFLESTVPDEGWDHDHLDGNADAHLRAMLVGPSVTVPVDGVTLELGTLQAVLLVECDGPRSRTVTVRPSHARNESLRARRRRSPNRATDRATDRVTAANRAVAQPKGLSA